LHSEQQSELVFAFRPWVRRAGLSIILVAGCVSAAIAATLLLEPSSRYGWIGERFVWVYIGTLWAGGLKIWLTARHPIAQVDGTALRLRPLHLLTERVIRWDAIRGSEQMIGGDRMIVYYDGPRGPREVALNLNLVKGRREFVALMEARLTAMGLRENVVGRSRFLAR
jgi:hypothetical protein